jgi:hypothetical protein
MFARGGVCTLYLGNCSIDLKESHDQSFQLDLGTDRCIYRWPCTPTCASVRLPRLLRLTTAARAFPMKWWSCGLFILLLHIDDEVLRAAEQPEPIPTIEMSKEKIKETVEKFGKAAARMKRAEWI